MLRLLVLFCQTFRVKKIDQGKSDDVRGGAESAARLALHLLAQRLGEPRCEPLSGLLRFHRVPFCQTKKDSQHKKIAWRGKSPTFPVVKEKKIDTRLEDYLFALVDAYAKRHGMKRTQVVVMALEKFFGLHRADPVEFAKEKILPMPAPTPALKFAEEPGASMSDPSDGSAGGSETAREIRYEPKRRGK